MASKYIDLPPSPLKLGPEEELAVFAMRDAMTPEAWRASPERARMIESHMYLVGCVASSRGSFRNRQDMASFLLVDLVRMADRFKPARGVRFGVFVALNLRALTRQYDVKHETIIHVPAWVFGDAGRDAAKKKGDSPRTARTLARKAEAIAARETALAAFTTDGMRSQERFARNPGVPEPPEEPEELPALRVALAGLTDRERIILGYAFGFEGEPVKNAEIGRRIGMSREYVRQLKSDALGKLRRALAA